MTERSNRCQQNAIYAILCQPACNLRGCDTYQSRRSGDRTHQAVVTRRHVPDAAFSLQFAQSIKWQRQVLIPLTTGVIKSVAFVSDLQCRSEEHTSELQSR